MKKILTVIIIALVGGSAAAYVKHETAPAPPVVAALRVSRGPITEIVASTGTLEPLRTVDIGTQVSGTVEKLYVDFNSIVKKGEVIAKLDPELLEARVDVASAALDEAKIALTSAQNTLATDRTNAERAETLFASGLATAEERDAAVLLQKQDEATVTEDAAAVTVAEGSVEQAKVNVGYCTITSPVDGVVIERDVDEGQAVAARASAPTLYVLASDITSLQLLGDVDEANVGKMRPGEDVTFHVKSFPGRTFHGTVTSVRLNAATTNNVVTYQVVIAVANPTLELKPAMTATIDVQTGRAANVLRAPNLALRFHPTAEMFEAFHQPLPPAISLAAANSCDVTPCEPAASTPAPSASSISNHQTSSATIDHIFPAAPHAALPGQVWVIDNGQLERIPVRLGLSDGTWTELESTEVPEGSEVITGITLPSAASGPGVNPLMRLTGGRGGRGRGR